MKSMNCASYLESAGLCCVLNTQRLDAGQFPTTNYRYEANNSLHLHRLGLGFRHGQGGLWPCDFELR